MREVIYIQAGRLANYAGTHFWNTQESYVPYVEDDQESADVDSMISFSESVDAKEGTTLYPRALIFDAKVNFGTLASSSVSEDDVQVSAIWSEDPVEYRQEAIPKSDYHTFLDEGGEGNEIDEQTSTSIESKTPEKPVPPSFDTVGATLIPEANDSVVSWQEGQRVFEAYDKENDVMDDAVRRLTENCDNMGAVQILSDTSIFGSFTVAFLEVFRDEYTKLLSFSFPFFTELTTASNEVSRTKNLLTEAFSLGALKEFSSMNVPLYDPVAWCETLGYPPDSIYHRSSLLSALVETSTLPFRLKRCSQDIVSIWAALNSRHNAQFAELSGVFPYAGPSDLDSRMYNLSSNFGRTPKNATEYARVDVSRGFPTADATAYGQWISRTRPTQNVCYIASVHAPAYPTPSSFPVPPGTSTRLQSTTPTPTMMLYSSLTASSNTASTFEKYAVFVDKLLCRPSTAAVAAMEGIARDELQELASNLWTMRDECGDDSFEDGPDS